jgi:hypothetical protein
VWDNFQKKKGFLIYAAYHIYSTLWRVSMTRVVAYYKVVFKIFETYAVKPVKLTKGLSATVTLEVVPSRM